MDGWMDGWDGIISAGSVAGARISWGLIFAEWWGAGFGCEICDLDLGAGVGWIWTFWSMPLRVCS